MELVYLWVEEYKNIKNQGFNFSPRFTCKYENGELTIEEKKDSCFSIFPPNINITAIVGENGAGKSSILEVIKGAPLPREEKSAKYIAVFFDSKKHYYYGTIDNFNCNITISKYAYVLSKHILNHGDFYHNINFIKLDGTSENSSVFKDLKHRYSYQSNNIFIPKFIQMYAQKSEFRYFNKFDTLRLILRNKEKLDKNNETIAEALQLIETKYRLQTQTTLREYEKYDYIDIKIFENGKLNSDIEKFASVQNFIRRRHQNKQ
jgi:energy-coupling factor transporter ATP-binding protein EcfA2